MLGFCPPHTQMTRLEHLCRKAVHETLAATNAVPLLEAAHAFADDQLLNQCRAYVAENPGDVAQGGGVEQLTDFGVTKGLLKDALQGLAASKEEIEMLIARNRE